MPNTDEIIKGLNDEIDQQVGNVITPELDLISAQFDKVIQDAISNFNSTAFDKNGFIQKMSDLDVGEDNKSVVKKYDFFKVG